MGKNKPYNKGFSYSQPQPNQPGALFSLKIHEFPSAWQALPDRARSTQKTIQPQKIH